MKLFYTLCITLLYSTASFGQCAATSSWVQGPGGQVSFSGVATGGVPPYNYIWNFGDNAYSTVLNPVHTYDYNAVYDVCFRVIDSFMCDDSICIQVPVTSAAMDATCPGDAVFTTSANGANITFTNGMNNLVIVDYGDGTPPGSGLVHQYAFNGSYNVVAISVQLFGNAQLTCDTSFQTVVVNTVPCQAAFNLDIDTSSYYIICNNNSFGDANVSWILDGTVVATNINTYFSGLLAPGTHDICLAITGPGSCIDTLCQSFTFNYIPICNGVTFSYAPATGLCDTYDFTISNSGPPLTNSNWYYNGNTASSSMTTQIAINFSGAGNNILAVPITADAAAVGCYSSWSHYFYNPAGFTTQLDTTGGVNTWYAYPNASAGVTSVLWDFGDGTTSNLQYPTHVYAAAGFYTVCQTITVNGACSYTYCSTNYFFRNGSGNAMSNFIVVGPSSVSEMQPQLITLSPNPSNKFIQIGSILKITKITIQNLEGSVAMKFLNADEPLNISSLDAGMYIVTITEMSGTSHSIKFIKF